MVYQDAERPLDLPATAGARADGRGPEEFRSSITLTTGAVPGAAGSAYAEFGTTKVILAVYVCGQACSIEH